MGIRFTAAAPARPSASGHLIPTKTGVCPVGGGVGRVVGDTVGEAVELVGTADELDVVGVEVLSGCAVPLHPAIATHEAISSTTPARWVIVG